ncbi:MULTISPECIES: ribonuclease III [Halomonas]|uniref:ribonuclease III n=1 Tax=Halomonas TaxID=2745 RepID=UPI001C951EE8|nr:MULTISPECIES: ribonuclease III [Halomonas]MED5296850.1 ribonuclease III [Pseudomonadota bacterium]MBY5925529.1 ribonuclease III [Halomonas sp. DP4Y7-2]MBY5930511.1 ribonuclease III [Halomonas sp. DP8Y7-3]MBY5969432.1 ribonuclease III [Halomonas denitrificans]MBY5985060.1 ribonuclease III [Halomonas sp. DP5Y7-2]
MSNPLIPFSRRIGHDFQNPDLLELAMTHRSYGGRNNERLEFLGDSIVNFVIAEALFARFPEAREGQLSRLRARLVKGQTLAELAREMRFGECLRLGSGEMKSGGHRRESILADAVEAVIGAIYLDAGMDTVRSRVLAWFEERLGRIDLKESQKDPKTRLQEFLQSRQAPLPRYEVTSVEGEAHAQTFTVECHVEMLDEHTTGTGASRRHAEQMAAESALKRLDPKGASA